MAMSGINNTNKLLLKPLYVSGLWCMSSLARPPYEVKTTKKAEEDGRSWWMPDPRTGIYFPKGQEWVMDDVPTHAASFDCTFWLRSNDGGLDHHHLHSTLPTSNSKSDTRNYI